MRRPTRPVPPLRRFLFAIPCLAILCAGAAEVSAQLQPQTVVERRYEMSVLPDRDFEPWSQLGSGPAFVMPDGTVLINDNQGDDSIGYQHLVGQIDARHRVRLAARVLVLSNFDGRAAIMEIARPGLQAALRLFPDRVELVERGENHEWRWVDAHLTSLGSLREIVFEKAGQAEDPNETLRVWVDGELVIEARPRAKSRLEVGRVVIGSVSGPSVGASVWDWVSYSMVSLLSGLPNEETSVGGLKARFRPAP